jgi:hypothetical protein
MYDVVTGELEFLADNGMNHVVPPEPGDRTSEEDGRLR